MTIQVVPISQIIPNASNPRLVNKDKFNKLKKSIKELPEMLNLRPIVVDKDNIILGGNMRYKALVDLGYKEVAIIRTELTDEQAKAFIIKDNLNYGDWDFDILANEWDSVELDEWGLDVWQNEDDKAAHTEEETEAKEVCTLCGK